MEKWKYRISILLNIVFLLGYLLSSFNSPNYELGKLEEDLNIGIFTTDSTMFKIPKGITVKNASERGLGAIGQFENNRFSIVITTDRDIVNYDLPKDSLQSFGNFYTADIYPGKKR